MQLKKKKVRKQKRKNCGNVFVNHNISVRISQRVAKNLRKVLFLASCFLLQSVSSVWCSVSKQPTATWWTNFDNWLKLSPSGSLLLENSWKISRNKERNKIFRVHKRENCLPDPKFVHNGAPCLILDSEKVGFQGSGVSYRPIGWILKIDSTLFGK